MIGQIHLDSVNVSSRQQSIPSCTLWTLPCQVKCLVLNCCTEIYFLNICIKQPRVLNEMSHLIWHPRHEVCSCPQPTPTAPLSVSVPLPGRKICRILLTPWHPCLLSYTQPLVGVQMQHVPATSLCGTRCSGKASSLHQSPWCWQPGVLGWLQPRLLSGSAAVGDVQQSVQRQAEHLLPPSWALELAFSRAGGFSLIFL